MRRVHDWFLPSNYIVRSFLFCAIWPFWVAIFLSLSLIKERYNIQICHDFNWFHKESVEFLRVIYMNLNSSPHKIAFVVNSSKIHDKMYQSQPTFFVLCHAVGNGRIAEFAQD